LRTPWGSQSVGLSIHAIQVVTLNPATYSGLEQDIGGIGPGCFADLDLLEDPNDCYARFVLFGGKVVAEKGVSLVNTPPIGLPREMMDSLKLKPSISPREFKIPCSSSTAKVRVMELIKPDHHGGEDNVC